MFCGAYDQRGISAAGRYETELRMTERGLMTLAARNRELEQENEILRQQVARLQVITVDATAANSE